MFIKTPSLEGLPTKAKVDHSPHEMRLSTTGHQPTISWSREVFIVIMLYYLLLLSLLFFVGTTSPLRGEKNALTSESYPLSEMSRALLRMKAGPSNAAFCKQLITMGHALA